MSTVKFPKKSTDAVFEACPAFSWWIYAGFVLMVIPLGVVLLSTSTLSRPTPRVVDDFETEASLTHWQGSIRISTSHPVSWPPLPSSQIRPEFCDPFNFSPRWRLERVRAPAI